MTDSPQPPSAAGPATAIGLAVAGVVAVLALVIAAVALATASDGEVAAGTDTATHEGMAPEDGAATPAVDSAAEPPPEFEAYDPTLEPAPGGRRHRVELHITEAEMEVAPGVTQTVWSFTDEPGTPMVPGPVLRGQVGDVFDVTLVNDTENTFQHSIDFHASEVAWDDEMRTISPGQRLRYTFEATHSGVWMYHCGTSPVLHHIGNGMYGAVVIDPPNLPEVDREFLFVQSEYYLGEQGAIGSLDKMVAGQWDAVVFNGYAFQYLHRPIEVEVGETIRAWVLDVGPSENSAFHIVGTQWDTVFREGAYTLERGNPERGGSQVLALQPAEGGFVEFDFEEAGLYPIVTHKFANPGRGALGLFQAGTPPDRSADGRVENLDGSPVEPVESTGTHS